jgi:hypothetical protein
MRRTRCAKEMLINDGDMSFISSDDEDFRWIDDYANGNIPVGLDTGDAESTSISDTKKSSLSSMVTAT